MYQFKSNEVYKFQEVQLANDELSQLKKAIDRTQTNQHVDAWSIFVLAASIVVFCSSLVTYITSLKNSTKNIIAYIKPRDRREKIIVENYLRELMGQSGAVRVLVGMFHNGTSVGSFHFNKMSVLYEVSKYGYASVKSRYKDVDFSTIERYISLSNPDKWTKFDTSPSTVDKHPHFNGLNLDVVFTRLLNCNKGIYGMIELQYTEEKDSELTEEQLQNLESVFSNVVYVLDLVRNNKKIPI